MASVAFAFFGTLMAFGGAYVQPHIGWDGLGYVSAAVIACAIIEEWSRG